MLRFEGTFLHRIFFTVVFYNGLRKSYVRFALTTCPIKAVTRWFVSLHRESCWWTMNLFSLFMMSLRPAMGAMPCAFVVVTTTTKLSSPPPPCSFDSLFKPSVWSQFPFSFDLDAEQELLKYRTLLKYSFSTLFVEVNHNGLVAEKKKRQIDDVLVVSCCKKRKVWPWNEICEDGNYGSFWAQEFGLCIVYAHYISCAILLSWCRLL